MYKFNINDFIKVKLTEHGKEIYKHRHDETCKKYPQLRDALSNPELKVDKDGYSEFQLHDFMNCFGSHIFNGAPTVIENNEIYFEKGFRWVRSKGSNIPILGMKNECTPVKNPKPFGAVGKMVKEVEKAEEKEKETDKITAKDIWTITVQCIEDDENVRDVLFKRFGLGLVEIYYLARAGRLYVDFFYADNYKSFEVYYLDDKPIIEVAIEKRYGELHGYGYLSQTEEEIRTIKVLK